MSIAEIKSIIKSESIEDHLHKVFDTKWGFYPDRILYLAYAFLRGIPYRVTEPTARSFFDCYGYVGDTLCEKIAKVVRFHGGEATETTIKEWLATPESETRKAKREHKEKASKAVRDAKRDAYRAMEQRYEHRHAALLAARLAIKA